MMRHQKNCDGTNSRPPHKKTLWHNAAACRATLRHIVPCRNAVAQKTAPWHETQCRSTKKALAAHRQCRGTKKASRHDHGTSAMPQQIVEGRGTKHNAAALITLPRHKAHCCSTKSCHGTQKSLQHKKLLQHKKMRCGTKQNATAHKTALRHKNSTTECCRCMCKATAKKPKTENATNHNDRRGYRTG